MASPPGGAGRHPLRLALMPGFPNVGKSALINRLVHQKVVESARKAGVSRSLQRVRLGQDLDLLDAPSLLPPCLDDQQAAYDTEEVALAFVRLLVAQRACPFRGRYQGCWRRATAYP